MRLATFNILHGRTLSDDHVDADRFAAAVASLDADVLALQEVDRDQERSHGLDLTRIAAEASGATESRFAAALCGSPEGRWQPARGDVAPGNPAYGNALLSRHPVRRWDVVPLPALPVRVPFPWKKGVRPHLVRDEARVAIVATIRTPRGDITCVATHLSYLPGWNLVQLRRLMRAVHRYDGPVLLMGDLNMRPEPARRATGLRPLVEDLTYPAASPRRQIDHVLAGDFPAVTTGRAVELPVSDHRALVVDVDVP